MDAYMRQAYSLVSWHETHRIGKHVHMRRGTGETGWWHDCSDSGKDYGGNPMDNDRERKGGLVCRTCGERWSPEPRGFVCLGGWAGRTEQEVVIVGETPQRYRIRSIDGKTVRLAGRCRSIQGDATALVPKRAIRLAQAVDAAQGEKHE